ncbi:MAG: chloride channel protein [Litorivicinaceae bacterium]|jgi:CIC family chloride channel protein
MQSRIKDTGMELLIVFGIGGLIGTLIAWTSNAYVSGVQAFTELRENHSLFEISLAGNQFELTSLIFLWVAAGIVIVIRRVFGVVRWHGPADSIYHAQQSKEPLDIKHGIASTLTAFTSAAGGGSVGQYGPLVHFGATLGIAVKRFVSSRLSHEVYLGCGVAAAISAGFGAPIAGIVFAHEAVLRHFSVRAIAPISIASVTASAVSQSFFNTSATFNISTSAPDLVSVIPVLIIASPIIAVAAIVYMEALRRSVVIAKGTGWSAERLVITAATICGLVGIWIPEILGLGIGTINAMLDGVYQLPALILLLIAKIAMTALCIGFGLFGGVFSPALFVGVAVGGVISQIAILLGVPDLSVAISIAAMAAVAANVIGAPVAAVLIILELTQSYAYAVAALMAVMASMLLTHRLFGHSFFDRQLLDRGIDLSLGREAIALSQHTLETHLSDDYVKVDETTSGQTALELMRQAEQTEAYVVSDSGRLAGKLSVHQAIQADKQTVFQFADADPVLLNLDDSLQHAMHTVSDFVGESVPIIDRETRELLGVITEGDLFKAVIDVQSTVRHQERD